MIRGIFAKILLWFWASTALVTISVFAISVLSGAEPIGRRWLSHTMDFYARSATDFYLHGGPTQLNQYLDEIETSSAIHAALLDASGKAISTRDTPEGARAVLDDALASGQSKFRVGVRWTGASVVHTPHGTFVFVALVRPLRGLGGQPEFRVTLMRIGIALLCAGLLSFWLARHISQPIRALQSAAGRIAEGDLSVRAVPAIQPRNDELADLARDFDVMAGRIQSLLQKQQQMLGDISHELRSPLARLTVSLELARRGDAESFEHIETDLHRLDSMIGEILTLTRLNVSAERPATGQVNLRKILDSVAGDAQLEGGALEKTVSVSHADECWLSGDPNLLRSCIENVVRNALHYTPAGSSVEISLTCDAAPQARATICVRDHGPGVPPESLARIFEPFYRVSEARDRGTGGTGLGLAIAQRVALLQGGTIEAFNHQGGGLEVRIVLPAQRSAAFDGSTV
jgi:two-component system sensor histidine kinase CpxA